MYDRTRRRGRIALALAGVALLVGACTGDGATPGTTPGPTPGTSAVDGTPASTAAGDATVILDSIAFGQDEMTVTPGTAVTWTNEDAVGHTVTHGENGAAAADARFDDPVLPGESVEYRFDESGTFPVTCTIHPQMNMTVVVE